MKCDKTKQDILDGCSDPETLEHLKECPDSKSFSDFLAFINENSRKSEFFSPPEKIGLAVRSVAAQHLRNNNAMEKPGKIKFLYYTSALAASFAIVAGILLFIPERNMEIPTKIVKDTRKEAGATLPGPLASLRWDDVDLTDEIEGVTEDIEISTSLIYSSDPEEKPADSEDMFIIDISETST